VAGEAVIGGDAEFDWGDTFAPEAMREVAHDVGLGFTGLEVSSGGFDGEGEDAAEFAEILAIELGEWPLELFDRGVFIDADGDGAIGGEPAIVGEFGDDFFEFFVPGTFLELKPEPGEFFLEDAAALDVIGEEGAVLAGDEDQSAGVLGGEGLGEIAAGSEPGDGVGPAEDECVITGVLKELGDPFVFLIDIEATGFDGRIEVVGGGIGVGWGGIVMSPVEHGAVDRELGTVGRVEILGHEGGDGTVRIVCCQGLASIA
jgi:hypothetical protein